MTDLTGLSLYSSNNFQLGNKDLQVEIKKVENGFLVALSGYRREENVNEKGEKYFSWDHINTQFVYNDLKDATAEIQGFFDLLEKWSKDEEKEKHDKK